MNQSKILITVLLALLILGGGFYVWKMKPAKHEVLQTPEDLPGETKTDPIDAALDTSDWKTYQNEEYGFEFKYPESLFDLKILPASDPIGVFTSPIPKEIRIYLTQKGYSIDDYKHQIWMSLNTLKSGQDFYTETQKDSVTVEVSFAKKIGKIYGTKDTIQKHLSSYDAFLNNGVCDPETFTVVFDERMHPDGDLQSYVHVGCEEKSAIGKVYRSVYQSIQFLED